MRKCFRCKRRIVDEDAIKVTLDDEDREMLGLKFVQNLFFHKRHYLTWADFHARKKLLRRRRRNAVAV